MNFNTIDKFNTQRLLLILILALTLSCQNQPNKTIEEDTPLDNILGDKILNFDTKEIRKDNFAQLIGIKKTCLFFESKLYDIETAFHDYYILRQKKRYSEARNFDILVKTNEEEIVDFVVFNDFSISDLKYDSTDLIILLSDFEQTNKYWPSQQQIQILKLDADFNEIWTFSRDSHFPLNGQNINIGNNKYFAQIEVITGCHICFVLCELTLSKNGVFESIKPIAKENSEWISTEVLMEAFKDPKK